MTPSVCVVSSGVIGGQKTFRTRRHRTAPSTPNWYKQCKVARSVCSEVQGVHVCLMKMWEARTRSLFAVDAFRLELAPVAVFVSVMYRFGSLGVACWPLVPKIAGSNPEEAVGFLGRKNHQHAFLRRGSKAVVPMS